MTYTYGEVPYPPCAGRVLTQDCLLIVERDPSTHEWGRRYIASAWSGLVLLAWRRWGTPDGARGMLLDGLKKDFGIEEEQ